MWGGDNLIKGGGGGQREIKAGTVSSLTRVKKRKEVLTPLKDIIRKGGGTT